MFEDITSEYEKSEGGERWIRRIDSRCHISVLHRRTGFGYMEWETALVFTADTGDRKPTSKDVECLIIRGDRREELAAMPKEELRSWYKRNIEGNQNSMETLLSEIKREIKS